jgi:hypothetical protein
VNLTNIAGAAAKSTQLLEGPFKSSAPFIRHLTVFDVDSREDSLLDLPSRIAPLDTFTWVGCLELPKALLQELPTQFPGISLKVIACQPLNSNKSHIASNIVLTY